MSSICLLIPRLHRGGFILFFVTECKRPTAASIDVVQEIAD
jgi:hypothetical protein